MQMHLQLTPSLICSSVSIRRYPIMSIGTGPNTAVYLLLSPTLFMHKSHIYMLLHLLMNLSEIFLKFRFFSMQKWLSNVNGGKMYVGDSICSGNAVTVPLSCTYIPVSVHRCS